MYRHRPGGVVLPVGRVVLTRLQALRLGGEVLDLLLHARLRLVGLEQRLGAAERLRGAVQVPRVGAADRLLAGRGGLEADEGALHGGLDVIGAVEVGDHRQHNRLVRDAVGLDDVGGDAHLRDLHLAEGTHVVHVEEQTQAARRGGVEVAEGDAEVATGRACEGIALEERQPRHRGVREGDLDLDVLSGEGDEAFDLLFEDAGHLVVAFDVPVVGAAGGGHVAQQVLVERGAEADAGGGDAARGGAAREVDELGRLDDTGVGHPVGEKDDAVDALDEPLLDVGAALEPAARKVGRASFMHAGDGQGRSIVAGRGRTEDGAHVVVEGDDGEPVVGAEEAGEANRGLLGGGEGPAAHRAGAVEDEGDVEGGAARGRLAGEGDEDAHLMGVLGGDELRGQPDVGLQGSLPG